jgi:hypothetical protein
MSKKLIWVLIVLFPLFAFARQTEEDIPLREGRIVFEETILAPLQAEEIKDTVLTWLENKFLPGKGRINSVDTINNRIVCRVVDYMEIERKSTSLFALYLQYTLAIEYKTNQCIVSVRNIGYIDPENLKENIKTNNYTVFPAETVLIEKKYKELFVTDPIPKIKKATLEKLEDLFFDIEVQLK